MTNETKLFLEFLLENDCEGWVNYKRINEMVDKVSHYFMLLSNKKKIELISDKFWIGYPKYYYHHEDDEPDKFNPKRWKGFGSIITRFIEFIAETDDNLTKLIIENGEGIVLSTVMKNTQGEMHLKAARRGRESSDYRVRAIAAKSLPIDEILEMTGDRRSEVRKAVIKRVGIDNCATQFINDRSKTIRMEAMIASPLKDFDYRKILDEFIDKLNKKKIYMYTHDYKLASSILRRIPREELVYYLNIVGHNNLPRSPWRAGLEKIISSRINN